MLHTSSLIAMLQTTYAHLAQQQATAHGQDVGWIPVFTGKAGRAYGLVLENGLWATPYSDGLAMVMQQELLYPFHILLESPFRDIVTQLTQGLQRQGMPLSIAPTFPLDKILQSGLASGDYWRDQGLAWLDQGYPPNERIAELAPRHPAVYAWRAQRQEKIFGSLKQGQAQEDGCKS